MFSCGKIENEEVEVIDVIEDTTEAMTKREEEFERQFKDWEKQFETWKQQNRNHPDKEGFAVKKQGERRYLFKWRTQILQKKERMQKAKAQQSSAAGADNTFNVMSQSLKSLSVDLGKLLDDDAYQTDVELLCGDHNIPAHGAILSARSEVFQKMLTTDMLEKRTGSVKISDIHPTVIKVFLKYIYTGTLPKMTVEMASQLYEAGDKYNVGGLTKECSDFLQDNMTTDNACIILTLADCHSDVELKECAMNYILQEKIPLNFELWEGFQIKFSKLASEVLYRYYKNNNS